MIKRWFAFTFLAFVFVCSSCKKDEFSPVKITYIVQTADSSTVRIIYNSDFYFDSGIRKPVDYVSNGGFWAAHHIAAKPEEYFIRVEYLDSVIAETDYQVKVIFNDTVTVDSVFYEFAFPVVELRGDVSNK